jgi:hypothetical protein
MFDEVCRPTVDRAGSKITIFGEKKANRSSVIERLKPVLRAVLKEGR